MPGTSWIVGYRRLEVMRLLAEGDMTHQAIADEYEVERATITAVNTKYKEQIQAMRDKANEEFVGLWIAEKKNRIAEMEDSAEILREKIHNNRADPAFVPFIPQFIGMQTRVMRAVADELGAIPSRIVVQQEPVKVQIEIISDELESNPKPEDKANNGAQGNQS